MNLWAVIPVKPFHLGKSRLATEMNDTQRAALNLRMFDHVLRVTMKALAPGHVSVVSADANVLARAAPAHALREPNSAGLNGALAFAARHAIERGARALMVLPADLPDLASDDIAALRDAVGVEPCCAVAPDAAETGTNALALAPPDPGLFRFGPDSFAAHVHIAKARGYRVHVVRRQGLAHDLDTPEGYRAWLRRAGASA